MSHNCESCSTPNRDTAKYCKRCGKPILVQSGSLLDSLIGLDAVKKEINALINITQAMKKRQSGSAFKINLHSIIVGNAGTGKSTLVKILQDLYFLNGITTKPTAEIIDAVDFPAYSKSLAQNIPNLKGGILFIDNAQKLVPGGLSTDINQLDKLFSEMDKFGFDPIVILAGLPGGFTDFLDKNPSIRNRFKYLFSLNDYNANELVKIAGQKLGGYNLNVNEYSEKKLKSLFKHAVKTKDEKFGNAHLAVNAAENIFKEYLNRIGAGGTDDNVVSLNDITGNIPEEKSLPEVLAEMEEYIGMDNVKAAVREIATQVEVQQERQARGLAEDDKFGLHIVLTGNPGTGKTTIARKLGEILAAINYLDSGHVVEVDRSQLIGQYKGETPKLVNGFIDKSMGGILFIDEAYALAPQSSSGDKDQYGTEAIETLMKRMEDERGKFVVIAAGYQTEMQNFLNSNPGMKSRFNRYLNIDDYTVDELVLIFRQFMKKKKYTLHTEAEETLKKTVKQIYDARDKNFGNGREMRKLFEETVTRLSDRLSKLGKEALTDNSMFSTIIAEDLPYKQKEALDVNSVMAELNKLIGLKAIKNEIADLVSYLNVEKKRAEAGGKETALNLHFVFNGNPGTGKTTVARLMGNIFSALGLLPRGHLIEADASKLVAGYSGQTGIKTNQLIDNAIGGVLFIDEAYTLSAGDSAFGKQAIDTLLKRMEDDRGKFIVIVAGYTQPMKDFLETNPGLASRFTKTITFDDYNGKEMAEILSRMLKDKNMLLEGEAQAGIVEFFEDLHEKRDKNFGNAREVRNIFEASLQRQGSRLAKIPPEQLSDAELNSITKEDLNVVVKKKKTIEEILAELDSFIGMDTVKATVSEIAKQMQFQQERVKRGLAEKDSLGMHIILTGNPGTGKTTISRKLGEIFKAVDFLPKGHVIETDRSVLVGQFQGQTPKLVNEYIDKAMGGILFIDEAYTLAPVTSGGATDPYGKEAIETLMKRMEDDRGKFVVIAAGYQNEMQNFLNSNPGMKSRFNKYLHIDDYTVDELILIFKQFARNKKFVLSADFEETLHKTVQQIYDCRDKDFGNGREMRKLIEETVSRLSDRVAQLDKTSITDDSVYITITPADLPYKPVKTLNLEDAIAGLNDIVGVKHVKDWINDLVKFSQYMRQRRQQGPTGSDGLYANLILTGNPGTGKTTIARRLGEIMRACDMLSKGHLYETDRNGLVGNYTGQTPGKVENELDKAEGGILLINNIPALIQPLGPSGQPDPAGDEAVLCLIMKLEFSRGKYIAIASGERDETETFMKLYPGLRGRFTKTLHIDDYKPDELAQIFLHMMKKRGYQLASGAEEVLNKAVKKIYYERQKGFRNAHEMERLLDETLLRLSSRTMSQPSVESAAQNALTTILPPDIPYDEKQELSVEEVLADLNKLVGMKEIKSEISSLVDYLNVERLRTKEGESATPLNLHFVFTGNPGTGKTTVARLMGKIFRSLGLLPRGHVVEADRSKLVANFVGQTSPKTNDLVDQSLGGILFIDEAYTLTTGGENDFGREAVDTLLKRLEDDRGRFIAVVAGYTEQMRQFIAMNPGLQSRFTRTIHFTDYGPEELMEIFMNMSADKEMIIAPSLEMWLYNFFTSLHAERDENFGNARTVRNIFEAALQRQSSRVARMMKEGSLPPDGIRTFTEEDIQK